MTATRRRMGILAIVLVLSIALLGVQKMASHRVISARFATLERAEGERSIQQVLKAIEADLNQLAISTHDYAAWDDAYQFASDRNPHFLTSNFAIESLANMAVDIVWIVDPGNRDIVALERMPGQTVGTPQAASGPVLAALRAQLPKMWADETAPVIPHFLQTPEGLLAFAAHPIVPTGGHAKPRGLLIFARHIDAAAVERARNTSQLAVDLFVTPESRARLPLLARNLWNADIESPDRVLLPTSERRLSGFALIRDINGAAVAIVGIQLPRTLFAFGQSTEGSLMLLITAVVAIFALIVCGLLLYLEKAGHERAMSERRYRAVITQAQETMLLVDFNTRVIVEANPAATATLGYGSTELLQMQVDDLFYACDGDVLKSVQPELYAAASIDRILIVRCKSRSFIDVEVTASPLTIEDRQVVSFVLRDVSARKKAERQLVHNQDRLTHLAHHDALTGLLNRLGLERQLPAVIAAAEGAKRNVAFMYMDIDHFKKINDFRGHACGDRLLQIAAERLRSCLSETDLIVRMGGDEFVVVASALRDAADAATIAARIRAKFAEPFEVGEEQLQVTSSVGVSVYPEDGADYEVLLKNADIALYEAKDAGRDAFMMFSPSMVTRVSTRLALEQDLRGAIRDGQFYLEYQPLIDLKTQRIETLEALVRWHHPIRGRVPPMEFIESAEKAGLICDIGEFVMRQACRQVDEWRRGGARVVPVAVNVSPRQFERQSVLELVRSATGEAGIETKLLHVELTESAFMNGQERLIHLLRELREAGIRISIDDFGTGYSSLSYLKHLPIDCLKIDRAFVRDMSESEGDAIVEAIVRMATRLGLKTVAEGVETPAQARRLRELGTTFGQGFYFSRPLAADVCGRLLMPPEDRLSAADLPNWLDTSDANAA